MPFSENTTIGFIGAGRMAQALSKGFKEAGICKPANMIASDVDETMRKYIAINGIKTTKSNKEVVESSQIIIIAVKPHIVVPVLKDISSLVTSDKLIVSIAAGITLLSLEERLNQKARVIRVMPNTPCLVNCGASVYSLGKNATADDGKIVKELFSSIGVCDTLPERYLDAVTGLSGSGPAYVFLMIEAMADGGVKVGLPRDIAQKLAAQTVMGAAKMLMETGQHPGQLKDAVCSPGGTTISGVHSLESNGFRGTVMSAIESATIKSKELGQHSN